MSIDFPPPPLPEQGEVAALRATALDSVTATVAGHTVYVHAPGVLGADDIRAALAGQRELSAAVRALVSRARQRGVFAPKAVYAKSGQQLYITLTALTVKSVKAPKALAPYFRGLGGKAGVQAQPFERARLLAGIHAQRRGERYTPVIEAAADGDPVLVLRRSALPAPARGSVRLALSNAGNRFTGRELLELDARLGSPGGNEFSAAVRSASGVLFDTGNATPGSDYREFQGGWSRVSPAGLVNVSARHIDYRLSLQGLGFNGSLQIADAAYIAIARASAASRVTVQGKLDYIRQEIVFDSNGERLQRERYPSAEVSAAYNRSFTLGSQRWLGLATLAARQGLGSDGATVTRADLDYWLARPGGTLRWQGGAFSAEWQLSGQYASTTVPELQQWVVGGVGNLHAYVPGVALGDRGGLSRLVLEHRGLVIERYTATLKPRLFVEGAAAEYHRPATGLPGGVQALADAGGEVVLGVGRAFEASLAAALPIGDDGVPQSVRDAARADFFFRLTAKF